MRSDIELVWTFMLDYTKNWGISRHNHDYFQMCFCLSGNGKFYLDGTELNIGSNDCLMMMPNQVHEMYPIACGQFRMIDTKFYVRDDSLYKTILKMPPVAKIKDNSFRELQQKMRGEWASRSLYSKEMATLYFEQSLYLYIRMREPSVECIPFYQPLEAKISELSGLEQRIANYMIEHYLEDITLDKLAHELQYSPNYLCKIFKHSTGVTINEYCNFLRIRKAYDMVCCTNTKLTEIAELCGFSSIHYFSRVFHKFVGIAPSHARDKERNKVNTDIQLHGTFRYRYYAPEGQSKEE